MSLYLIIISWSNLGWCSADTKCATDDACSGHGICVHGSCFCQSPWGGPACDETVLFDGSPEEDSSGAAAVEIPAASSMPSAPRVSTSSSPSKPLLRNVNFSGKDSGASQQPGNLAEKSLTTAESKLLVDQQVELNKMKSQNQAELKEMKELKSEIKAMKVSQHPPIASVASVTGKALRKQDPEDKDPEDPSYRFRYPDGHETTASAAQTPDEDPNTIDEDKHGHIKKEIDWDVQASRMATIHALLIFFTILIVLTTVFFSEMTRDALHNVIGKELHWEVDDSNPKPNIYRAVSLLKPSDVGVMNWLGYIGQAIVCFIMQMYIPVTLLYQNLVTYEISGWKDYSTISASWWSAMMLRTIGLFNLARLFVDQSAMQIIDEYKDDWVLLTMRRVRDSDRQKNDILIQFAEDLSNSNPTRRIAAAMMLARNVQPGNRILTPSKPEVSNVENVDVGVKLRQRFDGEHDDDEDGNPDFKPLETDTMAKIALFFAVGVVVGPDVVRDLVQNETDPHVIKQVTRFLRQFDPQPDDLPEGLLQQIRDYLYEQKIDPTPVDDDTKIFWTAWMRFWVCVSMFVTIVVATFLEVLLFIKIMVLTGTLEEVTLIVMALFFINTLDEKAIKGQPTLRKLYWVQCHSNTKVLRKKPLFIQYFALKGAVPLGTLIMYIGLVLMVAVSWRDRFTGKTVAP
eukprot:gnl/MRDRNA2_/MRDRNA2_27845_c0_seq1.p1 gnl/MRDRNA2_/MRDRNA2_27845_c0~~gnl/MRDRNA2_/MRDRNA2_27845_c0_seq1.p1  ORF type:complete len:684 (-),score=94.78 gnl/MRDRNA2_/MRDRNA2_27845_c0_seq1:48-2099(-)